MKIVKIAENLSSKNYGYVIKVNVPVTFYWNKDNTFDGIELELNRKEKDISVNERIQIFQLLERLMDLL